LKQGLKCCDGIACHSHTQWIAADSKQETRTSCETEGFDKYRGTIRQAAGTLEIDYLQVDMRSRWDDYHPETWPVLACTANLVCDVVSLKDNIYQIDEQEAGKRQR
jgi:hypothetical protein